MGAILRVIKSASYIDLALMFLVFVSLVIVVAPEKWFQTSFELEPHHYPAQIHGDRYSGGNSEAHWLDKRSQRWMCELKPGAEAPFCSMQVDLTDAQGKGIDLSRFDTMTIWADYTGNASHLRFYLRNRHPNYYKPGVDLSTKYNTIEVPVNALSTGLQVRMADFNVATWWLIGGNVPLKDSQPEFNEVAILEVQTGSMVRSGTHEVQVMKLVWTGRLVSQSTLYKAVIVLWSAAMLCTLVGRLVSAQRELKNQRAAQAELRTINDFLNQETRRFEQLANTDLLTGLRNRVGIRDIFYRGVVGWRNKRTPFSFIIIDLDNFKQINDTYGHDIGDVVLKDAAKLMLESVRHTDALARWGGEEFVLACPDTTLAQAAQIAENLRSTLEAKLKCDGNPVTASFGVATMKDDKLDNLYKKADMALYRAKQLGRNRVCTDECDGENKFPENSSG